MLVLTRKSEQKILIGKDIVITILRVYGDQVSIGIDAPKEMRIFREELLKESKPSTPLASSEQHQEKFAKAKLNTRKNSKWPSDYRPQEDTLTEVEVVEVEV